MKRSILRAVMHITVLWMVEVIGIMILSNVIPGLVVKDWRAAILWMATIGLLNAILWPTISRITLPFLAFTFGIGALVLNGTIIWLSSLIVPGVATVLMSRLADRHRARSLGSSG